MRTDQSLIDATLAGDSSAFDVLVLRYQDRLVHSLEHALGSHDEAIDIAQQTFVQAWRRLSTFRAESAFYTWLYRIARNIAVGQYQRQRPAMGSLEGLAEAGGFDPVDHRPSSTPEYQLNQSEQHLAVRNALQQIPEEFRQPLIMKELDGFSYDEIGRILEIPPGTVRSRIFRARQELADRLKRIRNSE
jgi:RNA polymerase sigma-70 factor (ECF subfamily)